HEGEPPEVGDEDLLVARPVARDLRALGGGEEGLGDGLHLAGPARGRRHAPAEAVGGELVRREQPEVGVPRAEGGELGDDVDAGLEALAYGVEELGEGGVEGALPGAGLEAVDEVEVVEVFDEGGHAGAVAV